MTLYTSVIKKYRKAYLVSAAIVLITGLIYECFSHNIISLYMSLAFVIPLLGFAFTELVGRLKNRMFVRMSLSLTAGAVSWLTLGSLFKGALEIYGTTNSLTAVFWIAGFAQLLIAVLILFKKQNF